MKASAPPGSPASPLLPADYGAWLTDLKRRIQGARQRALLAANGAIPLQQAEARLGSVDDDSGALAAVVEVGLAVSDQKPQPRKNRRSAKAHH